MGSNAASLFPQGITNMIVSRSSLLDLIHVVNGVDTGVHRAIAATDEITIDALTELRHLSDQHLRGIISRICENKRVLRVFLPPAAEKDIDELTDHDRLSTTPRPALHWKMIFDIMALMPNLTEIHITGDGEILGGELSQQLRGLPRWNIKELTACFGDELSLTMLGHCNLETLECQRITCYGRRLRELRKPSHGTALKHLELFYTATGIYNTWEDHYLPGLDVQSQEVIYEIFPNLHTLSMTHVETSPLILRRQDRVDYYDYPQKFIEWSMDTFDQVFSAIMVPSFPFLQRLSITVPAELVEWFCQNCGCHGAENFAFEDRYGHMANHISTWADKLWLVKLNAGTVEDSWTFFPEQKDGHGQDMNNAQRHQGDTDAPISRFVMFKTV